MSARPAVLVASLLAALSVGATPAHASGGSGSGGGGGTKPPCSTAVAVTAAATESLAGNSFTASYLLTSCQSKTKVAMTATDLSTGGVVWSSPDLLGTSAVWSLPYRLTSYRIDARAYSGVTGATLAVGSATVSTLDALPCVDTVIQSPTVGYWGVYPAIWAATDVQSCGAVNPYVAVRITNLATGQVAFQTTTYAMSSMFDFEGAIVAYSTSYRIEAELRASSGELLASSSTDVLSSALR